MTPHIIVREELFDEDMLQKMVRDERINSGDRAMLSKYFKTSRTAPSTSAVHYELASNVSSYGLGRLYPKLGLGTIRWDLRRPLLRKHYFDVDFENAHFRIAKKLMDDAGLRSDAFTELITDRPRILALVHPERWFAKTIVLATGLYGGELHLARDDVTSSMPNPSLESIPFIRRLQTESKNLAEHLWNKNKEFQKIKTGKDKKAFDKRPNGQFALMSLLLQTEERKCLMALDHFLTTKERKLDVLIHDGGCVRKFDGEAEFPPELLREGAEFVLKQTGYDMTLAVKDMNGGWTPPEIDNSPYEVMKREFEKRNYLIGTNIHSITDGGNIVIHKFKDAEIRFKNLWWKDTEGKKFYFLKEWIEDPQRRDYDRADFYPDRDSCPPTVFNLFHGFEAESLDIEVADDEINGLIEPIIRHLDILTSGYADYAVKWLANIIQMPQMKSEMGIFLRDMGGLLFEGGGTGKNLFLDWFGNRILGKDYYVMISNNNELYSTFNGVLEGKLLIVIEEATGKDNHKFIDLLKALITSKVNLVNRKGVNQYLVRDYARFMFCSNNANPLPIKNGDRRFTAFDVNPEFRNNPDYFNPLKSAMDDPRVQRAFYMYLSRVDTYCSPNEFSIRRPITKAYKEIKRLNASSIYKWLMASVHKLDNQYSGKELYNKYKMWCDDHGRGENLMSETLFGTSMSEVLTAEYSDDEYAFGEAVGSKTRTGAGVVYRINVPKLREGLVRLHLLDE